MRAAGFRFQVSGFNGTGLHGLVVAMILGLGTLSSQAQSITGIVLGQTSTGNEQLPGATVYWLGTQHGTSTDTEGRFTLSLHAPGTPLVATYVGYLADTVTANAGDDLTIVLQSSSLDSVIIEQKVRSTEISFLDPMKTEKISERELMKAACCNLSESFETNPSVDVSFTDAVTGTRQIVMLGLAGPYAQITRENMPDIRGLSAIYGLTYVPGPWVESMQLNKGAGAVINGFESITGQINVQLREPETSDKLYLNLYGDQGSRLEGNLNLTHEFSKEWSTGLLLHGQSRVAKTDHNDDGFMDEALVNHLIGLNRWQFYILPKYIEGQFGIKGTWVNNFAGQMEFDPEVHRRGATYWGSNIQMKRVEAWTKVGKVYPDQPWKSTGIQLSAVTHDHRSYFGQRNYDATQQSLYANWIYQSIIGNTNHKIKTGASAQYDNFMETLAGKDYTRTEVVPGGFFEYTYTHLEKFSAVAGIRADYHNLFGPFITPRLHMRYAITEQSVFRASGGRGQRTSSIIAENIGLLASSREIIIVGDSTISGFGLRPEIAWNYGANFTQTFRVSKREAVLSFDFYRTDFVNQVVIDLDHSPQQAWFYNLTGRSFSNSFQAQLDYEVIKAFDVRFAYRWYDVRTTFGNELLQKPLQAQHRAFANLAYQTRNRWSFDYTVQWQGPKRIPGTQSNPEQFQLAEYSDPFFVMNAQVSKQFGKWQFYVGGENLLNFRQHHPIISASDPFSEYFDSSLIWGPVFGRNVYGGLRFRVS